jgi:hypothetical protein
MGRTGDIRRVRKVCMLMKYKEQKVLRDTVAGLRVGRPENLGSISGRSTHLSSLKSQDRLWGLTQLPVQWVLRAPFSGVKRPGRDADYSPLPSAKIKNA